MRSIYRSERGEAEMLALYGEALESLDFEHDLLSVGTSFGATNVISAGRKDAPPLIFLPGGNFLNPSCLAWFSPLTRSFRVYSPDIIGQPGRSAQTRPSSKGAGHARWISEVLDALNLKSAPFVGISYGAGITLRLAGYSPERVERATLVSPSGFVRGPIFPMLRRVVAPMALYRLSPSADRLEKAAAPLLTQRDRSLERQLGAVYRNVRLDTDLPRRATRDELKDFHAPVMVFAPERDVFFPGASVLKRAGEIVPNLAHAELLTGQRHIPSGTAFERISARIERFR